MVWDGWVKILNLINKDRGSFFFIAELIIDLEVEPDLPVLDHCTCTACIDARPTEAIIAPYEVDGSKCISYFTIELKDLIPNNMKDKMDNWMLAVIFVKMFALGISFLDHTTKIALNLTQIYWT